MGENANTGMARFTLQIKIWAKKRTQVWLGLCPLHFCASPRSRLEGMASHESPDFQYTDSRDTVLNYNTKTPWPQCASELYRPSDRSLSAKLVPTFADRVPRGQREESLRPYPRISRLEPLFFKVAPHMYSRGWVDPVQDPLLLRKYGSAGNRTRGSVSVARSSDH
jgi:hypothetical protein